MPKPLASISTSQLKAINWLLTDVDDTLTWNGELPPESLIALAKLSAVGVRVVAVTGASAGWCDQIVKLWPVHGVIGENGAFWMQKNNNNLITSNNSTLESMKKLQNKLIQQLNLLLMDYPGIGFASDQPFRYCDVAINLRQGREPVDDSICNELLRKIRNLTIGGQVVNATESSIHLNVWVGNHTKRLSSEQYLSENKKGQQIDLNEIAYIGDSLNDETMFEWLTLTFGVRNIEPSLPKFKTRPAFITNKKGGYGFAELAEIILQAKK
ncbi:MAG: HAD-IIB family hydrolase [Psychromonas sp.]